MTTDRFPKMCAMAVDTAGGTVRLGACAKGAGMISPAMATMLCVVTTDAVLTPQESRSLLCDAVSRSFNRVTVDGEMSTNDSVVLPRQRGLRLSTRRERIWSAWAKRWRPSFCDSP